MDRRSQLFLLRELVRRDFTQRYAGSLLGFAWSFIQPLWQLALLSYVFSIIMRAPLDTEPTDRFWVFLFCGLLPWTAIHEGILRSATVVVEHADMVKKIAFPAEILVASVVTTALIHQGITLAVFLGGLIVVGELSWTTLCLLPVALFFQVALTLGVGYLVAAIQVYFRDMAQILGLVMNAWFYVTPIVYPMAMVPRDLWGFIRGNPLAVLVTLYRYAFLGGDPERWLAGLVPLYFTTAFFLFLGWWLFRRLKPGFADEI
jgi:lipopolysaccharide transport system permease protein